MPETVEIVGIRVTYRIDRSGVNIEIESPTQDSINFFTDNIHNYISAKDINDATDPVEEST